MSDLVGGLWLVANEPLRLANPADDTATAVQFEVDAAGALTVTPVSGSPVTFGCGLDVNGDADFQMSGDFQNDLTVHGITGLGAAVNTAAWLKLGLGSASVVPLLFGAGTLKTSPIDGAVEYDGAAYYGSVSTDRQKFVREPGSTGITTLGTIATGTWQGTPIDWSYLTAVPGTWVVAGASGMTLQADRVLISLGYLGLAAGTTTYVPLLFNGGGALKTVPVDGGVEYDGIAYYATVGTDRQQLIRGTGAGGTIAYATLPTGGGTWANGGALSITGGVTTVAGLVSSATITAATSIGMVSGQKFYPDGVAMNGDTFFLHSADNVWDFHVGDATNERLQLTTSGALITGTLTTTATISVATVGAGIQSYQAAKYALTSGITGITGTKPQLYLGGSPGAHHHLVFAEITGNNNDNVVDFFKTRANTTTQPTTAVVLGDGLMKLQGYAADGTNYILVGGIRLHVSSVGTVAANRVPTQMVFTTHPDSTGPAATALTLDSAQGAQVAGAFGCNTKAAQTAYASGGALAAYGAGANGFDTGANASALHAMVVSIRAALVANGIMS